MKKIRIKTTNDPDYIIEVNGKNILDLEVVLEQWLHEGYYVHNLKEFWVFDPGIKKSVKFNISDITSIHLEEIS